MEDLQNVLHETQYGTVPLSDSEYAEELQVQEALQASFTDLQISQYGESSRIYCEICTEEKERNQKFEIESCSHSFCSDCIAKHVQAKIEEHIHVITCPKCNSLIEPVSCRPIIPEDLFARWEETLSEATVLNSQKFYCPFKNCSAMLINEDQDLIRQSECPVCRQLFCAQCKVPWHSGLDCEEFQKFKEDEIDYEEKMLQELARKEKWMKCPNCNCLVEKIEGCIHMTCRCGFEFCYICGLNWSQSHWRCQS